MYDTQRACLAAIMGPPRPPRNLHRCDTSPKHPAPTLGDEGCPPHRRRMRGASSHNDREEGKRMDVQIAVDTVWVLLAGMLVFFMNLGFALVESGFARAKNTVNIISKNFIVFAVSTIAFLAIGWGLMYGDGNGFIGLKGLFMVGGADNSPATGEAYAGVYSALGWAGVPLMA